MYSDQLNIQRQIWKLPFILDTVVVDGADSVLLSDASDGGKLKMGLVSGFPGGGGGGATNLSYDAPTRTVVSDTGSDAILTLADGTNAGLLTSADFTKLSLLTITQSVNLDTLESDTALNNAKITNATHTGEVTGSTILTLDKTALTGKVAVTADPLDYILLSDTSDSGNLKKALVSDFGGAGTTNLAYDAPTRTVSSDTGSDAILTLADTTNPGLMSSGQFDKLGFITVTQAVDLDTLESDTVTNNAKITNATHTGEVTGATALTVDKTAVTNKSTVTADPLDYVLLSDTSDSGNLKKAIVSDFYSTGSTNLSFDPITSTVASDTGTDAVIPLADGTNPGFMSSAQFNKLGFITVTQAVDLDTIESDTATNNAKVTNATHTGDATGATALTVVKIQGTAISAPVAGDDAKFIKYDHGTTAFVYDTPAGATALTHPQVMARLSIGF